MHFLSVGHAGLTKLNSPARKPKQVVVAHDWLIDCVTDASPSVYSITFCMTVHTVYALCIYKSQLKIPVACVIG